MCQDGEASISRFNGDLCSSWKPCESMTARQIKPPYPRWLRHLNWQWLGWLCPNHRLCCSSSEASSWTEEMQTIDILHIFQWWTCQRSPRLQILLSYSSCWCHWTSRQRGVNKVHRSQNITPIHFLPLINDFNIWRLWVVSHFTVLCILPNIASFCREERLCQCAEATKPRSCFISTGTVCCRAINNHRHTFKSLLLFSEASRYFPFKKCLNESLRAVIDSLLWGGVQGRWCEVVLQQVEATAEHMPSGNQAACSTETLVWSHPIPCFCWEPVSLINTICQKRQMPTRNIYRQVESPAPHARWRKQKDLPPLTVFCQSGSCQSRKHEAVKAHRTGLSSRTGSPLPKRNLKYLKLN